MEERTCELHFSLGLETNRVLLIQAIEDILVGARNMGLKASLTKVKKKPMRSTNPVINFGRKIAACVGRIQKQDYIVFLEGPKYLVAPIYEDLKNEFKTRGDFKFRDK